MPERVIFEVMKNLFWHKSPLVRNVLWLPLILAAPAFVALSYFDGDGDRSIDTGHIIGFVLPFVALYVIHDLLLVRPLFMRGKIKAYIVSVILLLGLFGLMSSQHMLQPDKSPAGVEAGLGHEHHGPPPGHAASRHDRHGPPHDHGPGKRGHHKGPSPLALDMTIALLLVGSNLAIAFFTKYARQREQMIAGEKERLQIELEYLKAQINPHFLMNTLNNIHGMVEIDPLIAQQMIVELSRLMRYVLYEGQRPLITLDEEIKFITSYVTLMSKRYSGKKITIDMRLPEDADAAIKLPPLLFIVIIENAFKHGISYLAPSWFRIVMSVDHHNHTLTLDCANSRHDFSAESDSGCNGIGLDNLSKRLQLLFGQEYELTVDVSDRASYHVNLTIPYTYEPDTLYSNR